MRHSTTLCALVALTLALPSAALGDAAGIRSQMDEMADVIEQLGQWDGAARLRGTLDAMPDEELEQFYGRTDLAPLISQLRQLAGVQVEVRARVTASRDKIDAARLAAVVRKLEKSDLGKVFSAGLPEADYPAEAEFCPLHSDTSVNPVRRADTKAVLQLTEDLKTAVQAIEQVEIIRSLAQGIWNGLDRACDQTVSALLYGQDFHVACIPVDIVFAAVEFVLAEAQWGIGIAQANLEMVNLCDDVVTTVELTAIYDGFGHLHDDLDAFRSEQDARLDVIEAKWDLALRVLLERALQHNGGERMNVNYIDRLAESCDAADKAIQDVEMLGYVLDPRAKPALTAGQQAIPTDPKGALDLCRLAYRYATVNSRTK